MAGRKPKPTALKKLEGNPGKRKLNTKEPVPEKGMPDCPKWLLPWQEQLIRDIFGIVKLDGYRQFRTAFVEICKKVGKSELAAALLKRSKLMTATKRIVNYGNLGYYQVLSAEVGGKHGFSVSGYSGRKTRGSDILFGERISLQEQWTTRIFC